MSVRVCQCVLQSPPAGEVTMSSPFAQTWLQKQPRRIIPQAMPSSPITSTAASLGPHLSSRVPVCPARVFYVWLSLKCFRRRSSSASVETNDYHCFSRHQDSSALVCITKIYTPAALAGLSLACSLSLLQSLSGCMRPHSLFSCGHAPYRYASRARVVRGVADRKGYGGGANHEKVDRQTH